MARGNPGAILAMGIGTFLLALGWTGKYAQVWQALSGSPAASTVSPATPVPQNPPTDNNKNAAAIQDPVYVYILGQEGKKKVADTPDVKGSKNGTCPSGQFAVKLWDKSDNNTYCVASGKIFDPLPSDSGGQSLEGMGITIYPNGKKAYTRLPNAGYLHA